MALPANYTESTFASYLYSQLSVSLRRAVGVSASTDPMFEDITNDTLLLLGVSDITTFVTLSDIAIVRAVGRVYLWRRAIQAVVTQYDVTVEGTSAKRSQILAALFRLLTMAENEVLALGISLPSFTSVQMPDATIVDVTYTDPYGPYGELGRWLLP